jgi:glycerol-3-phosphate O-acyltransferase
MLAERSDVVIVPTAIAYDLVLEDRILAKQGVKRTQKPFAVELAEMIGQAVGYQSRAIVTFGEPFELNKWDQHSRRDVLDLAHQVRASIGRLHKVLPTALVARVMRPSMRRPELLERLDAILETLSKVGANLSVQRASQAADEGVALLALRGVIVEERDRIRIRDRAVLRYYARSIEHLLSAPRARRPH